MTTDYDTIDDMWWSVLNHIHSKGCHQDSRAGKTIELLGWSGRLTDVSCNFLACKRRALCPTYASAELLWYLSRSSSVDELLPYAPQYERFAEPDGTAFGAYGNRIANCGTDQLDLAYGVLGIKPDSRQVVVSMWNVGDLCAALSGQKRDLPCTVCWQFLVRDRVLHMVAYMRSNDAWLGMPYDVYVNTVIQKLMAVSLGIETGTYTHCVGSMHLYEKNFAASLECERGRTQAHCWGSRDGFPQVKKAVQASRAMRSGAFIDSDDLLGFLDDAKLSDALRDAVLCVGLRHELSITDDITSLSLREAARANRRGTRPGGQDDSVQVAGRAPESF